MQCTLRIVIYKCLLITVKGSNVGVFMVDLKKILIGERIAKSKFKLFKSKTSVDIWVYCTTF